MFDPEVAQGFSVDPEERKRLLIANALLGVSGGLLGARKGQELQGLGYGMLQGAGMGQQAVSAASQDRYNQFRMMSEGQKMVDQRRAQEQAARDAQEVAAVFQGGGAPDVSPLANGQGPTLGNAAAQAPSSPNGDHYRKAAQIYMRQNNPEKAKMALEMAAKEDEEFSQTPQVGVGPDGPYNYVLGKRGTEKRLSAGVAPKFREMSDNKTTHLINEYNVPSTGMSLAMQTTPGQDQTHGLELQKFRYQQGRDAKQDAKGPAAAAAPSGYRWKPDGSLEAIPGGPSDQPKNLTESQAKATAFANQMAAASRNIAQLETEGFTGTGPYQQGKIVAAGAEGIPFVPGSAAIPRALAGEKAQRFQNSELQWTEGALRFMTGANAPEAEVRRNADAYFPRPGDSAEKIAQKAEMRRNMEESVRLAAGGGNAQLPPLPKNEPKAPQRELKKNTTAIYKARQAIMAGKDPAAVRQRLIENGVDPEGI
jgi:hypothetical protein